VSLPKPKALRLLEGNPGHRDIPNAPEPVPEFGDPPEHFDDIARDEWYRVGGELFRLGLLTKIDRKAFEAYCWYFSQWRKTQEKIKRLEEDNSGGVKQVIWLEQKYADKMLTFMKQFGMTPVSRMKIDQPDDGHDPMDEVLDN
jgi:P27 family predicted phage terminase small subunit